MTTIVNNPQPANNSSSPVGLIIALVVLLVIVYLGFVYGLPALRQMRSGGVQINVPNQVDVNVHKTN